MHRVTWFWVGLIVLAVVLPTVGASAQEGGLSGAYYVVQQGDTLWDIAVRFKVSLETLELANDLSESSQITPGDRLLIPGLGGFQGAVEAIPVPVGETLFSLGRRYEVLPADLAQMNRLTAPAELDAGTTLILPADRIRYPARGRALIPHGLSILELAALNDINPWSLVVRNQLSGAWAALPGDVLLTGEAAIPAPGALPGQIEDIRVEPKWIAQGDTVTLKLAAPPGVHLEGSLAGRELRFFPWEGGFVALQGIHTMQDPGLYPLTIRYSDPAEAAGEPQSFSLPLLIRDGEYPFDPVLIVDPETIDPAVTVPEDELWAALGVSSTPEKHWQGAFQSPVPQVFKDCWTSLFGNRRSFNGSPYTYYHSGLDFCGGVGTELYAPAAGRVVFAGPLIVRGNATVIDHGWGVYTAYDHQSEIYVNVGDFVQPGQLLGLGGATGRVTGPHLHFEVWVGGVQVDPVDWLERSFP